MHQVNDTEYLQRPLIENMVYIIEDDYVQIDCPHTGFAGGRRISHVDVDELLSLYRRVLHAAKEGNVKISYANHTKRKIVDHRAEYECRYEESQKLFDDFVAQAKIVRQRGIHLGCSDDTELDKLTALRNRHMEYGWRNSVISVISAIKSELEKFETDLSDQNMRYDQIYL